MLRSKVTDTAHQSRVGNLFVEVVHELVREFDVIDVLTNLMSSAAELVGADAAGLLLIDESNGLRIMASSSEQEDVFELLAVQSGQGPSSECVRSGNVIAAGEDDLSRHGPLFAEMTAAAGFRSVCSVPLQMRDRTLGCVNLFFARPDPLPRNDLAVVQAVAEIAVIVIMHAQTARQDATTSERLEFALNSRAMIEKATEMIAAGAHLDTDEAFWRLHNHARKTRVGLSSVASAIVTGALQLGE